MWARTIVYELEQKNSRLGVALLRYRDRAPQGGPFARTCAIAADFLKAGRPHDNVHILDRVLKSDADFSLAPALTGKVANQLYDQRICNIISVGNSRRKIDIGVKLDDRVPTRYACGGGRCTFS